MKKIISLFSELILFLLLLASCKNDEDNVVSPMKPEDNEMITTMKCVIKDSGNPSVVAEAMFKDPDGEGGKLPVLDTIKLKAEKIYHVEIWLIDESIMPADTISYEVREEGDAHQFFFSANGDADVVFTYSDTDKNGVPIGLNSIWTIGKETTSLNGEIRIVLKHQGEDKPNAGNGNINIGSTDIDVSFPVLIQ